MHDKNIVVEFANIGELAETTTQLLALDLQAEARSRRPARHSPAGHDQVKQLVLQQARDYLARVREGFVLSVRTAQVADRREIRFLLDRVLLDWQELSRELGLEGEMGQSPAAPGAGPKPEIEGLRYQLLAFGMAAVALGHLPRLPSEQVTFPHSYGNPPTYADIPAPDTPGEMLWRIEEVESMLWQVMSVDLRKLVRSRYGPLRRTYGFFEASATLARHEMGRFRRGQ